MINDRSLASNFPGQHAIRKFFNLAFVNLSLNSKDGQAIMIFLREMPIFDQNRST
jgi:hypothetical protein